MAEKKILLRIITPTGIKIEKNADMIIMRCIDGDMGILPGREACTVVLDYGVLRILEDDTERVIAVYGGFAEIQSDVLTVLAYSAEWPEEIELVNAEADREHAKRRLAEQKDDMSVQRYQILLRRSLVRIEVSTYPIINKVK